MIEVARDCGVRRYFYTSSACVYPVHLQQAPAVTPLAEESVYPADAEDGYGWEKLFAERMCRHYLEDFGLETRVVRFHKIFGPLGTYDGGRRGNPARRNRPGAPQGANVMPSRTRGTRRPQPAAGSSDTSARRRSRPCGAGCRAPRRSSCSR